MENIVVSIGELWDKYSILLIKKCKINNREKLNYINKEIKFLDKNMNKYLYKENTLFSDLKKVNEKLWEIEDKLRIYEKNKLFDAEFIELARSVYYTNDIRAAIKKKINIQLNSIVHEVKDYVNYE